MTENSLLDISSGCSLERFADIGATLSEPTYLARTPRNVNIFENVNTLVYQINLLASFSGTIVHWKPLDLFLLWLRT